MRRRMTSSALLLVLGMGMLSACGSKFDVKGTLVLSDANASTSGCVGIDQPGYEDIVEGADIVIRDADGKKVAVGELGPGRSKPQDACTFSIDVPDVPGGSDIYSIEVSHRGEVSFKKDEAQTISLTLGE